LLIGEEGLIRNIKPLLLHGALLSARFEAAPATLRYLPRYSPDFDMDGILSSRLRLCLPVHQSLPIRVLNFSTAFRCLILLLSISR
jgi:hypothetical protein